MCDRSKLCNLLYIQIGFLFIVVFKELSKWYKNIDRPNYYDQFINKNDVPTILDGNIVVKSTFIRTAIQHRMPLDMVLVLCEDA